MRKQRLLQQVWLGYKAARQHKDLLFDANLLRSVCACRLMCDLPMMLELYCAAWQT